MSPVPDLPDPDAITAAIAACPSVSGLSGGLAGEVATYLPGRRVSGIRTQPESVEVHVIAKYGATLHEVESQVRGAVTAAVGEAVRIDVVLADVEDPFAPEEDEEPLALEAGPTAALPSGSGSPPIAPTSPAGPAPTAAGPAPTPMGIAAERHTPPAGSSPPPGAVGAPGAGPVLPTPPAS